METQDFDVFKMSQQTSIPVVAIKEALGLQSFSRECRATTTKEAKFSYDFAPNNSEQKIFAFKKWTEFFTKDIELVSSVREARVMFNNVIPNLFCKKLIFGKWVELTSIFGEAKIALNNVPNDPGCLEFVLRKLIKLSLDCGQIQLVFFKAPENTETKQLALKKWIELAENYEELKEVYRNTPRSSEIKLIALKKWVNVCKNPLEARYVYEKAPENSEGEFGAFKKWIDLCDSIPKIIDAFNLDKIKPLSSREKEIIFNKWVELASSMEELKLVYKNIPEDSELRQIILKNMASFFGWKEID